MNSTTASSTVNALRYIFAKLRLPKQICLMMVRKFKTFVKLNEIKHTIPPEDLLISRALCPKFHTSYEKWQQTVPMHIRPNRFLSNYRSTPHPTTGESPSKLLLGRNIIMRLGFSKSVQHIYREWCYGILYWTTCDGVWLHRKDTINILYSCGEIGTTYLPGQDWWKWKLETTHRLNAENLTCHRN